MENGPEANVNAMTSSRPKWQKLIRQNSEKIGTFAEAAVLPINQRSNQKISPADLGVRDVEATKPQRQKQHFPIFIVGISLIEVILMYTVDDETLLLIFGYDPFRRHEIWRFATMMLVHSGFSHLWNNVIFQLILGVLLEIVHSWKRIAIIYVSSVLGGSLFITVLTPNTYAVGASAGLYGLLFSHLSTIIINWNEMDRKCCRLFWLLFYLTIDIGYSFYLELAAGKETDISHAAHFGGAVTGFLVSILALKNFEKHPWEEKMQKICIGIIAALCIAIFLINVTAWGLYPSTEWNFNYTSAYENFIVKTIVDSPENSTVRQLCELDLDCKQILDQYKFNGTILQSSDT